MTRQPDTSSPKPSGPRPGVRAARVFLAFARARGAGGMLIASAFLLTMMFFIGGMLVDYSWRDAQWAEVESAIRAAVSAAAKDLLLGGPVADERAKADIAAFASAAAPGLDAKPEDVTISRAPDGSITVVIGGTYDFGRLFAPDSIEAVAETVRLAVDAEFYEVAIAIDQTGSMDQFLDDNSMTKTEALRNAASRVIDGMKSLPHGHMMVSVVPFSSHIRAADTCTAGIPGNDLCDKARSPGKETYLRMLTGIDGTIDAALARGRDDRSRGGGGHWVDVYHQYGVGANMGSLRGQYLPEDLLDDVDWDLRRTGIDIDLSEQIPPTGTWTVNDEDFWNGCVMARWGAYWRADARPPGWVAADADNWPVKRTVPAWGPGLPALAAEPVHLSDAPPDHADPNTLFTAFSYPDARIGGLADHRLQMAMLALFDFEFFDRPVDAHPRTFENDWSAPGPRGALHCSQRPISPLTADLDIVLAAATANIPKLDPELTRRTNDGIKLGTSRMSAGTQVHLGVVWGLRALSPLWQKVWGVTDPGGLARPAVPCGGGAGVGCIENLHKAIVLITDGESWPGSIYRSRLIEDNNPPSEHPAWQDEEICASSVSSWNPIENGLVELSAYHEAARQSTETEFHAAMTTSTHSDGRFKEDALSTIGARLLGNDPNYEDAEGFARLEAIKKLIRDRGWTAWQLFRETNAEVVDALMDPSPNGDASEPAYPFRFDGRPMLRGHYCSRLSAFGAYGRINAPLLVGETTGGQPADPVAAVAPFSYGLDNDDSLHTTLTGRLAEWTTDTCRLAGERKVKVIVIYFANSGLNLSGYEKLKDCVAANGGDPDQDVLYIPSNTELDQAFNDIFLDRRRLRFIN